MSAEITFILPTMNRRQYICRAVESCLVCRSERVTPHVLVIDGMSDDGSYELLQETYGNNPQVSILRHDRVGFQRTAYFGVSQVKTEYVTFMYDDDLVSPFFYQMFEAMLDQGKSFIMGYGYIYDVDRIYPFKPVTNIDLFSVYDAVLAYFGYPGKLHYHTVPFSPICCIVKTEHLQKWVHFSQEFAGKSPIRHYYMIDRNIGPDIIIYLSGIMLEPDTAAIAPNIVGQFSEHNESMSVGYGDLHLQIGYWLGKIWAFEETLTRGNRSVAAQCAGHLIRSGLRILRQIPSSQDREWVWPFCKEIIGIITLAVKNGFVLAMLTNLIISSFNKYTSGPLVPLPE